MNNTPIEQRARRLAKRLCLSIHKDRSKYNYIDRRGGWQIRSADRGTILFGQRFELSIEDVLFWMNEGEKK